MKLVVAIVKPFKLEELRDGPARIGIQGLTATEVKGFGRQKGQTEIYCGAEYAVLLLPKIKIKVAVAAEFLERVVEVIRATAATGRIGDGKIIVLDREQAIRIGTGETNA